MKKNALIALSMMMLSVFSMTFTSCGDDDDDDDPVIVAPKYAEDAALYQISGTSEFTSIEFTEDGMYIITKADDSSKAKGWGKFVKSKTFSGLTRGENSSDKYIHGKYTKNGDVYTLEGFGTITVEKEGDVNIFLKIQPTGKEAYTLSAQPVKKYEDSDITNKLCHAWKFDNCRLVITNKGDSVLLDKTLTKTSEIYMSLDSIYKEKIGTYDDAVEAIFTKSGTYIIKYADNTIAVAQWKLKDEKKGLIYFTWEYDKFDEENFTEISFDKNNNLIISTTWDWSDSTDYFTHHFLKTK